MAKPDFIELPPGLRIPILYEDRSVLAIDKPRGWMLAPASWRKTGRNLLPALTASIAARDFWARSRNLKYLRFVHRLDAETTGVLLLAKSPGALARIGALFQGRQVSKSYLAVVLGVPSWTEWTCRLRLASGLDESGRVRVDERHGREAETVFRLLQPGAGKALLEAQPLTGRTHQIRVHLVAIGHPVVGDELYGPCPAGRAPALGLRAAALAYRDPFTGRHVQIRAPCDEFARAYGFQPPNSPAAELVRNRRT